MAKQGEEIAELRELLVALNTEIKRKKIQTFDELAQQDKEAKIALIELAQQTAPTKLKGFNIAIFGLTSTGKSTMLNALLGQNLAETGVGETTKEIKAYPGTGYTLWDRLPD